jgi:hypothetical protein
MKYDDFRVVLWHSRRTCAFESFRVAKPLLERAFSETCGIEMKDLFFSERNPGTPELFAAVCSTIANSPPTTAVW